MKIHGYMGMSLDGYIADKDGGVGWMEPFNTVDYGFDRFIAGIGTVVMGRATFDQSLGFAGGWPYASKRSLIVTSRPIGNPPPRVEAWHKGVPALIAELRAAEAEDGEAWVVGGAALQAAFIAAGAVDSLEVFVLPVLLGAGVPMFPRSEKGANLELSGTGALPMGMVRLAYKFAA